MNLPPMDDELRSILGRPNFACIGLAQVLRKTGQEIKPKSEDEQAAVIYWMLSLYLQYGVEWREHASRLLKETEA